MTARHPQDLPKSEQTVLTLSDRVLGLGGASCGPIPMARDIVRSVANRFRSTIFEISKGEDAGALGELDVPVTAPVIIERDRRGRMDLSTSSQDSKISYRIDGGDWQVWKSPFVLQNAGKVKGSPEAPDLIAYAKSSRALSFTMSRDGYRIVSADSEQAGEGHATHAIDGKPDTHWRTQWEGASPMPPHEIVLDLGMKAELAGIAVLPRQDQEKGRIGDYELYVSLDGSSCGAPAAQGKFSGEQGLERVLFPKPAAARFIRLIAHDGDDFFATATEYDFMMDWAEHFDWAVKKFFLWHFPRSRRSVLGAKRR